MNLLYVDPDGRIRSGRLTFAAAEQGGFRAEVEGAPLLVSRTGDRLGPRDVLALLAPPRPTEDQRATLWRAHRAGFRVENA